jgi:hypothetical protein
MPPRFQLPVLRAAIRTKQPYARISLASQSSASQSRMASSKVPPPKNEMVYFPNMTTSLPSSSGEFRRVLWTGLYSQVVLMTIPVGGDIGDEVSFRT